LNNLIERLREMLIADAEMEGGLELPTDTGKYSD
jgi:hypothetical protein